MTTPRKPSVRIRPRRHRNTALKTLANDQRLAEAMADALNVHSDMPWYDCREMACRLVEAVRRAGWQPQARSKPGP